MQTKNDLGYIYNGQNIFPTQTLILVASSQVQIIIMAFYSLLVILFSFFCFSCSNQTNQTHGPCELTNPTWVKSVDKHLLLQSYLGSSRANVIVAKDGSGNFRNVKAAIDSIPKSNNKRYVIYIKGGVYDERVEVKSTNVMLVGDGIGKTIITGNRSVGGGFQTHDTATFGKYMFFNYVSIN